MPETWVAGGDGTKRRVKGWWVGDATGARREVKKAWVGTPAGNKLVYDSAPKMVTVLSASPASASQINLSWTATPGCTYFLEGTSGLKVEKGTALSHANTGLAQKTTYNYRVDVYYENKKIGESHASATTPAVPVPATSSASVNGPGAESWGGWVQSTQYTPRSASFNLRGYISSFNLLYGGRGGTGYATPYIGGTSLGGRTLASGVGYKHVDGGNTWVNGSFTVGATIGGNSYATEWRSQKGASDWRASIACGTINYWWYTRSADGRSVQAVEPWWSDDFDGVDIHVESWVDSDGEVIRAVVTDKASGELLREWERE